MILIFFGGYTLQGSAGDMAVLKIEGLPYRTQDSVVLILWGYIFGTSFGDLLRKTYS